MLLRDGTQRNMFTGIIEAEGKIIGLKELSGKRWLTVQCGKMAADIKLGESVACNGICLTVIEKGTDWIQLEIMNESLHKTTASDWKVGMILNLERAVPVSGRFDGHIVQGHVDTTAKVVSVTKQSETTYLTIHLPEDATLFVVGQGSIAINGVSLTIAALHTGTFQVALIGFTLSHTNLRFLKAGDNVNLEFDIIGKYVSRMIGKENKGISKTWLEEQGF